MKMESVFSRKTLNFETEKTRFHKKSISNKIKSMIYYYRKTNYNIRFRRNPCEGSLQQEGTASL